MAKSAMHIETGRKGEDLAVAFVVRSGYRILERNWRHKRFEVDIIACKGDLLCFFEVKTRTGLQLVLPEASVSEIKLSRLKVAAATYLAAFPEWKFLQFNILSITLFPDREPEIFMLEDVF